MVLFVVAVRGVPMQRTLEAVVTTSELNALIQIVIRQFVSLFSFTTMNGKSFIYNHSRLVVFLVLQKQYHGLTEKLNISHKRRTGNKLEWMDPQNGTSVKRYITTLQEEFGERAVVWPFFCSERYHSKDISGQVLAMGSTTRTKLYLSVLSESRLNGIVSELMGCEINLGNLWLTVTNILGMPGLPIPETLAHLVMMVICLGPPILPRLVRDTNTSLGRAIIGQIQENRELLWGNHLIQCHSLGPPVQHQQPFNG